MITYNITERQFGKTTHLLTRFLTEDDSILILFNHGMFNSHLKKCKLTNNQLKRILFCDDNLVNKLKGINYNKLFIDEYDFFTDKAKKILFNARKQFNEIVIWSTLKKTRCYQAIELKRKSIKSNDFYFDVNKIPEMIIDEFNALEYDFLGHADKINVLKDSVESRLPEETRRNFKYCELGHAFYHINY